MEQITNQVMLRGSLVSLPCFSHENHGRKFFRFSLEVPRLSGAVDTLPVITDSSVLDSVDLSGGEMLTIIGQIRSHNIRQEGRRHLLIYVYAQSITAEDGEPVNNIVLEGLICRDPTFRRTPLGREICDVMLAVPRAFKRADYVPCILWGKIAKDASECHTRDRVRIIGRLQSRAYTKITPDGAEEHTAYEISALSAELPSELY